MRSIPLTSAAREVTWLCQRPVAMTSTAVGGAPAPRLTPGGCGTSALVDRSVVLGVSARSLSALGASVLGASVCGASVNGLPVTGVLAVGGSVLGAPGVESLGTDALGALAAGAADVPGAEIGRPAVAGMPIPAVNAEKPNAEKPKAGRGLSTTTVRATGLPASAAGAPTFALDLASAQAYAHGRRNARGSAHDQLQV